MCLLPRSGRVLHGRNVRKKGTSGGTPGDSERVQLAGFNDRDRGSVINEQQINVPAQHVVDRAGIPLVRALR